ASTVRIRSGCRWRRRRRAHRAPATSGRSTRASRSGTDRGGPLAMPRLRWRAFPEAPPAGARLRARASGARRILSLPLLRRDRALRQPGGGPARLPQGAGSRRPRPAPDAEQPRDQPSRVRPLLVGPACAEAYAALPSREPAPARGEDWLRQPGDGVPDGPGFLDALVPEPHPGDEADRQAATSRHRLVQPRAAAGLVSVRADRDAGAPRVVDVRCPDRLTR